jgi:hypothetical protein
VIFLESPEAVGGVGDYSDLDGPDFAAGGPLNSGGRESEDLVLLSGPDGPDGPPLISDGPELVDLVRLSGPDGAGGPLGDS